MLCRLSNRGVDFMAKTVAQQDGEGCNRRRIKIYAIKITRQIASTNTSTARAKLNAKIDIGKASMLCRCMSVGQAVTA